MNTEQFTQLWTVANELVRIGRYVQILHLKLEQISVTEDDELTPEQIQKITPLLEEIGRFAEGGK